MAGDTQPVIERSLWSEALFAAIKEAKSYQHDTVRFCDADAFVVQWARSIKPMDDIRVLDSLRGAIESGHIRVWIQALPECKKEPLNGPVR